jgi:cytidylate kinase
MASSVGAAYLDTGAMYRAVTLAVLRADVPVTDGKAVIEVARSVELTMGTDPAHPAVLLDGADVEREIRGPEVTAAVSAVSAVAEVRELLVAEQRRLIKQAIAHHGGVVVEGRDIGTVVAPDAALKVYLTASAHARAQRRTAQDVSEGRSADLDTTRADVQRRDALDSGRQASPLRMAEDAIELDTTELGVADVLADLRRLADSRGLLGAAERTMR